MAKWEDDREEALIVNKITTTLGKELDLIKSRNTKNRLIDDAETAVPRRIYNKQGKVCRKYAYGQECKYGEIGNCIHKIICKIWAM